jgi:hypothetical protein
MRTLLALGMIPVLAAAQTASATVTHLGDYGNNQYFISENVMTVHEGRELAQATGASLSGTGHLVAINDAAEQQWINNQLIGLGLGARLFWIGLSDEVEEGVWRWDSGEDVTFTNWSVGEPNNWLGEEHHVHMNWSDPGIWNDVAGWRRYHSLIEVSFDNGSGVGNPNPTVPEPASLAVVAVGLVGVMRRVKLGASK